MNEETFKERIELSVDRVMHQTIPYRCLMDVPWFGIVDAEGVVRSMSIRFLLQFIVKADNAVGQMH